MLNLWCAEHLASFWETLITLKLMRDNLQILEVLWRLLQKSLGSAKFKVVFTFFCHMNRYEILEIFNLYLLKLILIFYYTSFNVCVYLCVCVSVYMVVHISWGTRRGQKITWGCGFSPSTLQSLWLKFRSPAFPLPTEAFHQSPKVYFVLYSTQEFKDLGWRG